MKNVGILLNISGMVLVFALLSNHFSDMSALIDQLNSVEINVGGDGPTSVFYTAKISRQLLVIAFALIAIFAFNVWRSIKKHGE